LSDEKTGKSSEVSSQSIPADVESVLKTSGIGYLSVTSGKGDLYSYPVAFYFAGFKVYFMTPISAAKLKFIRANPEISFLVDNHLLTKGACGAMIQGRARVFSIAKTVVNIMSLGPKMAHFAQKYPGMFTFYASGKELPDERKLYKYRLIRVDPKKILYWQGYKFGKYIPKGGRMEKDPLSESSDETKMETLANLLKTADEELPVPEVVQASKEWEEGLQAAGGRGELTRDELKIMNSHRNFLRTAAASSVVSSGVTTDEKNLLKKWKEKGGSTTS
jgi:hypothetical protein